MSATPPGTATVVIFAGDAPSARRFAVDTRLAAVMLPDPNLTAAAKFQALTCPRVFALDARGRILYTNNHADDKPRIAAPGGIVRRALAALSVAQQNAHSGPEFTVQGQAGTVQEPGGAVRTVLGDVDALVTPEVVRRFTISNRTAQSQRLTLAPSCSCITAEFSGSPPGRAATLAPGASSTITVRLDALELTGGPFWKAVLVESGAGQVPCATLVLSGASRPPATFTPLLMPMNGAAGLKQVGVTQIVLGARLRRARLRGICSNPWVRVSPPAGGHAGAWRLTIPAAAPAGMVAGAFWLEEALPGGQWRRVTADAVIAGNRTGPVSALPAYVRLRTWGEPQTYRLRLLGAPALLKKLMLGRASSRLSASLSADGSMLIVKMLHRSPSPWQGEVVLVGGGASLEVPLLGPPG